MKEREISLLDLLVEIGLHWRGILAVMLAGAVLAGAFSYARSYRAVKALEQEAAGTEWHGEEDWLESLSQLEKGMTDAQIQSVKDVLAYEVLYKKKLAYQQDSLLMKIDPDHVNQTELTFYITSDKRPLSCDIEKAYEDAVSSGGMYKYAAKQTGQAVADMIESISLGRGLDGLQEGTNTFEVRIIHCDKDVCQRIAKAVVEFLEKEHGGLEKSMGRHQVLVARQSFAVVADTDILERQKASLGDLMAMADTLRQRKDAFAGEESQYYESLAKATEDSSGAAGAEEKPSGPAASGMPAAPGADMKYVIFGAVLAASAYILLLFLKYVLNARISAADKLQELYGIPQFGMVPRQGGQNKPFASVDQWLLSFREHNRRRFTKEEALRLSAVGAKMAAMKEGFGTVCLVGCRLGGDALKACEAVKEALGEEGIQAVILDNVLYDTQAMGELEGMDGAVLVERVQSTLYSEICQELELLGRQEVKVLGGILVEG